MILSTPRNDSERETRASTAVSGIYIRRKKRVENVAAVRGQQKDPPRWHGSGPQTMLRRPNIAPVIPGIQRDISVVVLAGQSAREQPVAFYVVDAASLLDYGHNENTIQHLPNDTRAMV